MDGLPVTIRLLDPPLHEFLPSVEELAIINEIESPQTAIPQGRVVKRVVGGMKKG